MIGRTAHTVLSAVLIATSFGVGMAMAADIETAEEKHFLTKVSGSGKA